ncbi:MAG: M28 family peptidase [Treponema sp.]|nr:M28 family peptidase [Treponema sp.]
MKQIDSSNWSKVSPYDRYSYFIALKVDRYKNLLSTVEKLGLNFMSLTISGNRHFLIFPANKKIPRPAGTALPAMGENPIMLTAHYDRVEGSPGANDNSIAVFHLLRAAMIMTQQGIDNWIIIFTDKEELVQGETFDKQGSFTLAQQLRAWGLEKVRIFNFDACGTGDTFIFSNIIDSILNNNQSPNILKVKNELQQLRSYTLETAHRLRLDKMLLAPMPFCDDMGFLRAGFAAQTITMLPAEEAKQYESILRSRPEFADLIISGGIKNSAERRYLPATWKNMNTPADTPDRLTPNNFGQLLTFIVELCR